MPVFITKEGCFIASLISLHVNLVKRVILVLRIHLANPYLAVRFITRLIVQTCICTTIGASTSSMTLILSVISFEKDILVLTPKMQVTMKRTWVRMKWKLLFITWNMFMWTPVRGTSNQVSISHFHILSMAIFGLYIRIAGFSRMALQCCMRLHFQNFWNLWCVSLWTVKLAQEHPANLSPQTVSISKLPSQQSRMLPLPKTGW